MDVVRLSLLHGCAVWKTNKSKPKVLRSLQVCACKYILEVLCKLLMSFHMKLGFGNLEKQEIFVRYGHHLNYYQISRIR